MRRCLSMEDELKSNVELTKAWEVGTLDSHRTLTCLALVLYKIQYTVIITVVVEKSMEYIGDNSRN